MLPFPPLITAAGHKKKRRPFENRSLPFLSFLLPLLVSSPLYVNTTLVVRPVVLLAVLPLRTTTRPGPSYISSCLAILLILRLSDDTPLGVRLLQFRSPPLYTLLCTHLQSETAIQVAMGFSKTTDSWTEEARNTTDEWQNWMLSEIGHQWPSQQSLYGFSPCLDSWTVQNLQQTVDPDPVFAHCLSAWPYRCGHRHCRPHHMMMIPLSSVPVIQHRASHGNCLLGSNKPREDK